MTLTFVLILFFSGASGRAVTSVPGFASAAECEAAGTSTRDKMLTTAGLIIDYSCVQQSRAASPLPQ